MSSWTRCTDCVSVTDCYLANACAWARQRADDTGDPMLGLM